MKNRDDDFFKLPKAKNPLRRTAPEADKPAAEAPKADPAPARVPPIVSAEAKKPEAPAARQDIAPPPRVEPKAESRPEPKPEPKREAMAPQPADGPAARPAAPSAPPPRPRSEEPTLARNPLRRDPSPEERAASPAAPSTKSAPPAATKPKPPGGGDGAPPAPPAKKPSRLWLWPVFGIGVIGIVIIGGLIGYWVFMNVAARLVLADQPLTIRLPEQENVTLRTNYKIDVLMKGVIHAQVPLVQTLDLPVDGTYDTIVDLDTKVPLETVITYEGVIPVDSMADIEAKAPVNFQNVKKYKNLHFKAKLPLKLNLPVKLVVPVKQVIPLKYKGPLRVTIKHVIKAPVGTTLNTALKVNQTFGVPVTSSLPLRATLPQHPVKATIVDADLNLDLSTLRLEQKPKDAP